MRAVQNKKNYVQHPYLENCYCFYLHDGSSIMPSFWIQLTSFCWVRLFIYFFFQAVGAVLSLLLFIREDPCASEWKVKGICHPEIMGDYFQHLPWKLRTLWRYRTGEPQVDLKKNLTQRSSLESRSSFAKQSVFSLLRFIEKKTDRWAHCETARFKSTTSVVMRFREDLTALAVY